MWPNIQRSALPASPSTEPTCRILSCHANCLHNRQPGRQNAAYQQRQRCHQHRLTDHLQLGRSRCLSQKGVRLQSKLQCCIALAGTVVGEESSCHLTKRPCANRVLVIIGKQTSPRWLCQCSLFSRWQWEAHDGTQHVMQHMSAMPSALCVGQ